jgi:hypothetical protein
MPAFTPKVLRLNSIPRAVSRIGLQHGRANLRRR